MKKFSYKIAIAAILLAVQGCGSDTPADNTDSGPDTENNGGDAVNGSVTTLTGVLRDSPVQGVTYVTASGSDVTDADGQFTYEAGETVTFSIGATVFPAVTAGPVVTPQTLAAAASDTTAATINIARLLQSLDQDGNPDNGITIRSSAAASASPIDFDVPIATFATDTAVINLVSGSGSVNGVLVSAEAAVDHLNSSLGSSVQVPGSGGSSDQSGSDIILDLRGTTWVNDNEIGCDGAVDVVTLSYSQTGASATVTRAEDNGQGCIRENQSFPELPFAQWNNQSGFLFVCGGDAMCTFDELNYSITLAVGDPRNDCTQNGVAVPTQQSISHTPDSGIFTIINCQADDLDVYELQSPDSSGAATNYDGLWLRNPASTTESGVANYSFTVGNSVTRYNGSRTSSGAECHNTSSTVLVDLGNNRYRMDGTDGTLFFLIVRVGNTLEVTQEGEAKQVYTLVTELDPETLPLCAI